MQPLKLRVLVFLNKNDEELFLKSQKKKKEVIL